MDETNPIPLVPEGGHSFDAGDLYDWYVQGKLEGDWRYGAARVFVAGVVETLVRYRVLSLADDFKYDILEGVLIGVKECVEGDEGFRETLASTLVCQIIEAVFKVNLPPHLKREPTEPATVSDT